MLAGGQTVRLPFIAEIRGEPLKRKLYGLRDDVERLGATDGCVACTNLVFRASVTDSATNARIVAKGRSRSRETRVEEVSTAI